MALINSWNNSTLGEMFPQVSTFATDFSTDFTKSSLAFTKFLSKVNSYISIAQSGLDTAMGIINNALITGGSFILLTPQTGSGWISRLQVTDMPENNSEMYSVGMVLIAQFPSGEDAIEYFNKVSKVMGKTVMPIPVPVVTPSEKEEQIDVTYDNNKWIPGLTLGNWLPSIANFSTDKFNQLSEYMTTMTKYSDMLQEYNNLALEGVNTMTDLISDCAKTGGSMILLSPVTGLGWLDRIQIGSMPDNDSGMYSTGMAVIAQYPSLAGATSFFSSFKSVTGLT